jgi:hypothetical protein
MEVKGSITVTGGDAATQTYATTAASSSASTALTSANSYTLAVDNKVFTDASGKLAKTPSTTSAGLYLGSSFMGYYNGSEWKTYMANNGNFFLSGTGVNGLSWDGSTLNVVGNGTFSGTLTSNDGRIGGWFITTGALYSSNSAIYLDAVGKKITVNDTAGIPRVSINQNDTFASFTAPGGIGSTTQNEIFHNSGPYSGALPPITIAGSSFTATSGVTWRVAADENPADNGGIAANWSSTFDIAIYQYRVYIRRTTSPFTEYTIYGSSATNYDGGTQTFFGLPANGVASFTGDGGTYEIRVDRNINAFGPSAGNNQNHYTRRFTFIVEAVSAFTEIIPAGIQTGNSGARFVKMIRGAATTMLEVGGAITATDNITAYASDERLKENIIKIDNPLDRVMQLQGVHYDWKPNTIELGFQPSQKSDTGVLAQDVQRVLPNAVKIAPFDNDGDNNSKSGQSYLTVQYEKIVPLLIEAIKELKGEIDKIKNNK